MRDLVSGTNLLLNSPAFIIFLFFYFYFFIVNTGLIIELKAACLPIF